MRSQATLINRYPNVLTFLRVSRDQQNVGRDCSPSLFRLSTLYKVSLNEPFSLHLVMTSNWMSTVMTSKQTHLSGTHLTSSFQSSCSLSLFQSFFLLMLTQWLSWQHPHNMRKISAIYTAHVGNITISVKHMHTGLSDLKIVIRRSENTNLTINNHWVWLTVFLCHIMSFTPSYAFH